MARPRPVPSARPVTNGSNTRSARSGGTPGPVSRTTRSKWPGRRSACRVTAPPAGAWRMALVSRLSRMRPTTCGSSSAVPSAPWTCSASRLAAAVSAWRAAWSGRKAARSTGAGRGCTRCVIASSSPTSASNRSSWPSMSPMAMRRRRSSPARAFSPCSRAAAMGLRISCATPAATRPSPARRSACATRAAMASASRLASARRRPASFRASTMRSSSRCPVRFTAGSAVAPAPASAASIPRTCRPHAQASCPSQADISSPSPSSTASPVCSGRTPCTVCTRAMAQAVKSGIGPPSGQACSSRTPVRDATLRAAGWSSCAACMLAAAIRSRSAAGRSVLGPVPP